MASLGVSDCVSAQPLSFRPPALDLAMPEAELNGGQKEETMVWDKGGIPKGIPPKLQQDFPSTPSMAEHQRKGDGQPFENKCMTEYTLRPCF